MTEKNKKILGYSVAGLLTVVAFAVLLWPSPPAEETLTDDSVLKTAGRLAEQYDYDTAVSLLQTTDAKLYQKQIADYTNQKQELVKIESVTEIPHIFFHSLIVDPALAFHSEKASGYNQNMATVDEFREMLRQLYENHYVLVSEHDIAVENQDGFTAGEILLPKGKRPIIISQDDVNYYESMSGDGFATRMVVQDGKVLCEYQFSDGTTDIGQYDLVPVLDAFVEEHPDFSYHGAKAIIAVTGYEGAFGYHWKDNDKPGYSSEEAEAVTAVAECLRQSGYEIASHSYGHPAAGDISPAQLRADTKDWEDYIQPAVGDTDIYIYPYGSDITSDVSRDSYNSLEKFEVLYQAGYRYFLNVDNSKNAWVQISNRYVRQGRRDIDGFRMYYYPAEMFDIFYNIDTIYDSSRPAVPSDFLNAY